MPALSSILTLQSDPSRGAMHSAMLGAERLRAGLEACGYRCTSVVLPGVHAVPPGCTVALQFGDQIEIAADGRTWLMLRCSLQINGSGHRAHGTTRWQIHKAFPARSGDTNQASFAIDVDLILGSEVRLADVLTYGGDAYRHLHMLIGDASATLRDVSRTRSRNLIAPVVRIEARFFGNLAAGRSGLVAPQNAASIARPVKAAALHHLQVTRDACDLLKDDILPDLASAIRRIALQAQTTIRYRPIADGSPQSAEEGFAVPLVPVQAQS